MRVAPLCAVRLAIDDVALMRPSLMSQDPIPERIKQFIWRCIDRLETLDVLLVLCANARRMWSLEELRREMRSSPLAVEMALRELASNGLIGEEDGRFGFRPETLDLEELTRRLAECYRDKRTAIITLIYSRSPATRTGRSA